MDYPDHLLIRQGKSTGGEVILPLSKSISNRLLIISALSSKRVAIPELSDANDTRLLKGLLKEPPGILDARDAGTAFRFLTAFLAMREGHWVLTGSQRMKERPVEPLVKALHALGAKIDYSGRSGFPPLTIHGETLQGGRVEVEATISSQFISALMMIAPQMPNGLEIKLLGKVGSRPYIEMTAALMKKAGVNLEMRSDEIHIPHAEYHSCEISVERDWSSAAFFYSLIGMGYPEAIVLNALRLNSIQGDQAIDNLGKNLGVSSWESEFGLRLHHHEAVVTEELLIDFTDYPDLAQAVVFLCAARGVRASIKGLESLRIKETDRILAMQIELRKMGGDLIEKEPGLWIVESLKGAPNQVLDAHNDHRMAMAMAPLAQRFGSISLTGSTTVVKSFPGFWENMKRLGFEISAAS